MGDRVLLFAALKTGCAIFWHLFKFWTIELRVKIFAPAGRENEKKGKRFFNKGLLRVYVATGCGFGVA